MALQASNAEAQCDAVRVASPSPHASDWFGRAVATDGEWLFVASPGDDTTAPFGGVVDVYRLGPQGWQPTQRLFPSQPAQWMLFGWSLAAEGGRLAIGAPFLEHIVHPAGGPFAWPPGEVYVFELSGGTWAESARLTPSNGVPTFGPPGESFGQLVELDGSHLLVGAPLNDATGPDEGTLYAFEETPAGWVEVQRLQTALPGHRIGEVFDLEGDVLVAKQGLFVTSNAAMYQWDGAQWVFQRGLFSPVTGGIQDDVSLSNGRVAMSNPFHTLPNSSDTVGIVAIFEDPVASTVNPTLVLGPGAAASGIVRFGTQFELVDDVLYAVDRPHGAGDRQRVYRHIRTPLGWTFQTSFTQAPGGYDAGFGYSVTVEEPRVFVSAPWETSGGALGAGAVWISIFDSGVTSSCPCDLVAPCGTTDPTGGCLNSTGQSGRLAACGTTSIGYDDLVLRATGLPPFQFVLPFMGNTLEPAVVLGAGRRCAGGIARRYPPVLVGATGAVTFGPGIAASSASLHGGIGVAAGTTWTFQLWYRDNAQPCSNVNLTNGVTVNFRP